MPTTISVVLITANNNVNINKDGSSATRIYVNAAILPDKTPTFLPEISDSYADDWTELRVISVIQTYIDNDPNCGLQYEVQYSSVVDDTPDTYEERQIPRTIDMSSEYQTYRKTGIEDGKWFVWDSDDEPCNDFILKKREVISNFTVHRRIYADSIQTWTKVLADRVGLVNSSEFYRVPQGSCMFLGASMTQYLDNKGRERWRASMKFSMKVVDDNWELSDAWLKVWRPEKNTYEKPTCDGRELYEKVDFNVLITKDYASQIEDEI